MRTFSTILAGLCVALALVGCQRSDDQVRQTLRPWIGQPVRTFVEQKSISPTDVFDVPGGGRTFLFRRYAPLGSCGITIKSQAGAGEFIITELITDCPPQLL